MTPGVPCAVSPLIRRIVAPNPGLMTGPGTNTYLVGVDEVAVIDPGPDDGGHVDAIVGGAMRDRVRWVVLTHTHPDHWPATRALLAATGATLVAAPKPPRADAFDLTPDRVLADGDVIEGSEWALQVLLTPGHAPNHVCLFLDEERTLFTGDHVLSGTTTVVNPKRGGDMEQYLASTRRLRAIKRLARICPGHGDVITEPYTVLDEYLTHRAEREQQILGELAGGPRRIRAIVADLYPEIPDGLVEMARRQVHAHLVKLQRDGLVTGTSFTGPWTRA
jgi:glyoxylase-like metal-dependent hydrolase (beta-lactamase superfamily II)